jgi:hypothetical protein
MDRRRQPRINALLPVRIWGVDSNCLPFMQLVTAMNISEDGALVQGMRSPLRPGEVVDVQYNSRKAEFVVVWAGRPGTENEGEIGLQSLPSQPCIWDAYLERSCEFAGEG